MSKQASMLGTGGRLINLGARGGDNRRALPRFRGKDWHYAIVDEPEPQRLIDKVRSVMSDNRYRAAFEIQQEVDIRYGTYASESSIAARIRELRQSPLNLTVLRRKAPGKRYYQYALEGE